ncbi:glycosyl transferase [Phyllobacterium sp. BT25]|uniref:Glycosyl transferase n=1 Tax=Phyllobacterium pellucidum TaxID=2740464 RepID=A0A849VXT7_9HYPH|nr:glycosyltransferase [Phyllobacterium pellucidum]NTS33634.1 glycosyl transferase [Phyllobacterium pellucidum]
MTPPRIFFYVQHLLGIGHLARASRVASALAAAHFDVLVVTGGTKVPGFPAEGIKSVALPAVVAASAGFSGLADINGDTVGEEFLARRRALLLEAFHEMQPDIVITEAFPFGRRQMRFELLPLLGAIEAMAPRPIVVASIRDILQERAKPGRDEETVALAKEHFDHVLVHGDRSFVSLPETFPLAGEIEEKIIYTGLVAAPAPEEPDDVFDIVVSAGGGAVGIDLILAALALARRSNPNRSWCLITGPNLSETEFAGLAADLPDHVRLFRFRKDFPALLKRAELSISQAGYNTVCDILQAGCRSILVPFTAGGETEQRLRATRLAAMDRAVVVPEMGLNAGTLGNALDVVLAKPRPLAGGLDLKGAQRTAEILRELVEARGI